MGGGDWREDSIPQDEDEEESRWWRRGSLGSVVCFQRENSSTGLATDEKQPLKSQFDVSNDR